MRTTIALCFILLSSCERRVQYIEKEFSGYFAETKWSYNLKKNGQGMVDTALDVKTYVKSVFGASSPQYKQVSALKFTKRTGD